MAQSQPQNVDNLDGLLDLSEYDNVSSYQSPSLSPVSANKTIFPNRPSISSVQPPTVPSTANQPTLSGPSHQYDLYKQQTGIVPGALASTLAVNQANAQVSGYNGGYSVEFLNGLSPGSNLFDFNTVPGAAASHSSHASPNPVDMEMDFDSPPNSHFLYPGIDTINPNSLTGQESPVVPTQPGSVGRLWPGMHTQAAAAHAKAQAQQRQQQQILHSQGQQHPRQQSKSRSKSAQPTDPIVEQKITQLLNSMRAKTADESTSPTPTLNVPRPKKDEDDMDEDERLLASEEGKKLSSKERRQLRNKVSARAFRSRRKEYISQLETEIANKVSENGDLRVQNRALLEENKRLSDLTRMLLSSPSFSNFLDQLSNNPQGLPPPQQLQHPQHPPVPPPPQPMVKTERLAEQQPQPPKDANPYAVQQQIGMALIPEQDMDFSLLNANDAFTMQPQVFAVVETPDVPAVIDATMLSGKSSNFVGDAFESEDDKIELAAPELPSKLFAPEVTEQRAEPEEEVLDDEFEKNPEFALYHSSPGPHSDSPIELDTDGFNDLDIFGGIEPEKVLARYELVDAPEEEAKAMLAMARVQRISASLEPVLIRLEQLCL
ncbi:hypothetical protein ACRALDRAFT_2041705 [Sodiomyces alcalophilus JCM 7366]|uniref:uncharacterized protein n=1 Tax=Sodiomyces alcalophilus JCM 7366 TaxID=591952 RepID=UPI0039B61607